MEMKMEEKLSLVELVKRVAKLLCGNISLAFVLVLCSLPLFCFLILFELSLQTTLSLAFQFLSQLDMFRGYSVLDDYEDLSKIDLIPWLTQTSLLYFFPYTFLDLLTTTTIAAASSIAYTSQEEPLGVMHLVRKSIKICQKRAGGCLITYLYVLLSSTYVFLGFFSASTNYLLIATLLGKFQNFGDSVAILFPAVVVLIQGTFFIVITAKFSKWSVGWNMGVLVSVLEEDEDGKGIYGSDALSRSAWYGRGYEKLNLWMMSMFLVFALVVRMPCLYSKCSENSSGNGVFFTGIYVGIICFANVLKWVACVVCYHDCKTQVLEKKGDVEKA